MEKEKIILNIKAIKNREINKLYRYKKTEKYSYAIKILDEVIEQLKDEL